MEKYLEISGYLKYKVGGAQHPQATPVYIILIGKLGVAESGDELAFETIEKSLKS
ncbi:hypothetical protein RintRC_3877 [Richelia intracellularis]|nr:hypothetical protein RintRC_3877 [Richelia intracellularis]